MSATALQLPEILDNILEYASCDNYGRRNLYACLFVSRQFHAHAIRLLYRNLTFHAKLNKRRLEAEYKLGNQLCQQSALALHVRSLIINVTDTSHKAPFIPFKTRMKPVLRSLRNLQHIKVYTRTWILSLRSFSAVLHILNDIESRPEVSFWLDEEEALEDDDIQECGNPILRIDRRLPLKSLNLPTFWSPRKLQFLSQFRQLNSLSLRSRRDYCNKYGVGWEDLDIIFKDIPLSKLVIGGGATIQSFPSNLKSLCLGENSYSTNRLMQVTWSAVCRLRELTELKLEFTSVEEWDDSYVFLSNLGCFKGHLPGHATIIQQILNPIFSRSSRLRLIDFTVTHRLLYPNFIKCLVTTNPALTRLYIEAHLPTLCNFYDFAEESTILPKLTQLNLPWPISIDGEIRRNGLSLESYCLHYGGVPQQLTFDHCKRLAAIFPNVEKIEFKIPSEKLDTTWSRYSLRSNGTPRMPFKLERVGEVWVRFLERFQAVKMDKLIHPSSPCLDICTLLYRFPPDSPNQWPHPDIITHLYLDQVRKHPGP